MDDWLGQDHLARFVDETVDHLETMGSLDSFFQVYRVDGLGRAAYHPKMMVKIMLYGYCLGCTSSRKLAQALSEDIPFRFLSANQQPNFRTSSDFRKNHLQALEGLFTEILTLCQVAGLAKMGRAALDGRKVQGNASLSCNRDRQGLKKEVKRLL
ncbi:MAG: transposase [SAR324 cluster bacterium]|nr:transposase [SAR324 cluster bacterium]